MRQNQGQIYETANNRIPAINYESLYPVIVCKDALSLVFSTGIIKIKSRFQMIP